MITGKKKLKIMYIILLMVIVTVGCSTKDKQNVTEEKRNGKEEHEIEEKDELDIELDEEARSKIEQLTEEELRELIKRSEGLSSGEIEEQFSQEELDMLGTLTEVEIYDLIGMSEEEVYNFIYLYHNSVNLSITNSYKLGINSENYEEQERHKVGEFEEEFKWIINNFDLGSEYFNELAKDVVKLSQEHKEGDNDALYQLKYVLYEMDMYFNKEKEERISNISISDVEKIRKGEEPNLKYDF